MMKFKEIISRIKADLQRYRNAKGSIIRALLLYPGFRYTFLLRICSFLRSNILLQPFSIIMVLIFWRMQRVYGVSISYGTKIGGGVYIPHIGLCVINPGSQIGKNLYISQGVTVGKAHTGRKAGVPVIGDNVFLGPNCCVLGAVKIGDGAAVGANSVVLDDVPSGVFVAGNPARVVAEKGSAEILGNPHDA